MLCVSFLLDAFCWTPDHLLMHRLCKGGLSTHLAGLGGFVVKLEELAISGPLCEITEECTFLAHTFLSEGPGVRSSAG